MRLPLLLLLASSLAIAEDDPRLREYHDYAALTAILSGLTDKHPDLVSVTPLAETRGGRKVWVVEVADRSAGDPSERPAILILGGLSGEQPSGSEVALAVLLRLIESTDEAVVAVRRSCTFYILPRVHPDGVEARCAGTVTPYDDDHDGLVDEDPPADVDGDGAIVAMRRKDPAGEWLIDAVDPRAMRKADTSRGERGEYALCGAEGLDADGDGRVAEDDLGGVLLERNFPIHWQARPDPPGAGWSAVCEPETRAVADFLVAHRNIDVAVHYAGAGNVLYWPPAWLEEREVPGEDVGILHRLAEEYSKATGLDARRVRRDAPPLGRPTGTWLDWAYEGRGIYAFEACLWDLPEADVPAEAKTRAETKDAEGRLDDALKRERMWLAWSDVKLGGKGFVPWRAFQHPTLGEVEVGGWRAGAREAPPAEALPALSEKQLPWLVQVAGHLPRVELIGVESKPLGGGHFSVRARVRNAGYLPTASWQARRAEEAGPVVVELAAEGLVVTMGQARRVLKPLAGAETSDWIEWVVTSEPRDVLVRAWGTRAGRTEVRVRLGE
ncbi:MAG: M14 family metallopeptidase [Planctomycetota bacterium]